MLEIIIFIISLYFIIKGADLTTDSAIIIAKKYGISDFLIGLTVVAFGTSLPELASSITAVMYNTPEIAVSNILGSNIANIGLVLGLTVLFYSKNIRCKISKYDIGMLLLSVVATVVVFADYTLKFYEGVIFILLYLTYMVWSIKSKTSHRNIKPKQFEYKVFATLILGLIALAVGANYMISSGLKIIELFGFSKSAFGFVFIAIGTSLPELAASLMSIKKKAHGLAVGNIIGSNLFNTFIILGTISTIEVISVARTFYLSVIPILAILTVILYLAVKRKKITRIDGIFFVALYILSLVMVF